MEWVDPIARIGAVAVFLLVFAAAVRGDLRFRPGVNGQIEALQDTIKDVRDQRDRAMALADKLGDALEARNRRDEQSRREDRP